MQSLISLAKLGLSTVLKQQSNNHFAHLTESKHFKSVDLTALNKRVAARCAAEGKTWVTNLEKVVHNVATELFKVEFKKIRPAWLQNITGKKARLELDLFNPDLGVNGLAIETNGRQHFGVVPHFHRNGVSDFEKQRTRDHIKRMVCKTRRVILIEVPFNIKRAEIASFIIQEYLKQMQTI